MLVVPGITISNGGSIGNASNLIAIIPPRLRGYGKQKKNDEKRK
jgi:hypothetical protein